MDTPGRPPRSSSLPARPKDGQSRDTGPYILQSLFAQLPLETPDAASVRVTCVESWDGNLYVGTSASEILHFVKLPPDPSSQSSEAQFILASRLQPNPPSQTSQESAPGVQSILLLTPVAKAIVICNGQLTFYSLPEFSPAFGNIKLKDVAWAVIDQNDLELKGLTEEGEITGRDPRGCTVLLGSKKLIRLIRVGPNKPSTIKDVSFPASTFCNFRHPIACVANSSHYALIDVNNNSMVPLPTITQASFPATPPAQISTSPLSSSPPPPPPPPKSPTLMSPQPGRRGSHASHGRTSSLGSTRASSEAERPGSSLRPGTAEDSRSSSPKPTKSSSSSRASSPKPSASPTKLVTSAPSAFPTTGRTILKPHIASPTPTEFLLVTGTEPEEPGIGMFVDLNGDPVMRATLEFSKYPDQVTIDSSWVLAAVGGDQAVVECFRWNTETLGPGENEPGKQIITVGEDETNPIGLANIIGTETHQLPEVAQRLKFVRLGMRLPKKDSKKRKLSKEPLSTTTKPPSPEEEEYETDDEESSESTETKDKVEKVKPLPEWEVKRNREEEVIAARISVASSKFLVFRGNNIYTMIETPLLLRLDSSLPKSLSEASVRDFPMILRCWSTVEGVQPQTEAHFHELAYIRQKCGLLLLGILLSLTSGGGVADEIMKRTDVALSEGGVDPRVVISMFGDDFRQEIVEGSGEGSGIWIYNGIKDLVDEFIRKTSHAATESLCLSFLKNYLQGWRAKKGFGSIANEAHVFSSVDCTLLRILLMLDIPMPVQEKRMSRSIPLQRQELYNLVDSGVENFSRAVEIIEEFDRLYVLSRLYQKMKQSREVLATWRRILAKGDGVDGGEFPDGEMRVKEYLGRLKDAKLVEEFGAWLARRNPALGIQLFSDEKSRVKFPPEKVVEILKTNAPDAVRGYLEYLVVEKKNTAYANELLHLYLDKTIADLSGSSEIRDRVQMSTETYQALRAPKPTFIEFIADNSAGDEWWRNRLQLLEFLSQDSGYNVADITKTILPWKNVLVAESIVLLYRQKSHLEVIRLLCHSLRDFDTAINYCYDGGKTVFKRHDVKLAKREEQSELFNLLLVEFLRLDGFEDRMEQTCNLLERFGGWLDVQHVLSVVPDNWSINLLSKFLVSALRQLVREKSETNVAKALSSSVNLKTEIEFLEKIEELGPTIESGEGGGSSSNSQ